MHELFAPYGIYKYGKGSLGLKDGVRSRVQRGSDAVSHHQFETIRGEGSDVAGARVAPWDGVS